MSLIASFSGIRGAIGGLSDGIVILGLDGWPKLANRNILLNFGEVPFVLFNLKEGDNNNQDSQMEKGRSLFRKLTKIIKDKG